MAAAAVKAVVVMVLLRAVLLAPTGMGADLCSELEEEWFRAPSNVCTKACGTFLKKCDKCKFIVIFSRLPCASKDANSLRICVARCAVISICLETCVAAEKACRSSCADSHRGCCLAGDEACCSPIKLGDCLDRCVPERSACTEKCAAP